MNRDLTEIVTNTVEQHNSGVGEVVSAFVSMVRNGLILLIGDRAHHYKNDVVSVMDPMTRLVVNLYPDTTESKFQDHAEHDLRVAVHRQNPEEFLNDVRHHFLNLVVTDCDFSERLAQRITSMLLEGACWLILNTSDFADVSERTARESFHVANLGSCLLLVKKTEAQSAVRKGGRRARLAGGVQS